MIYKCSINDSMVGYNEATVSAPDEVKARRIFAKKILDNFDVLINVYEIEVEVV